MGFTVPVLLRALRRAMYAQDVFEVPGCFQHKHSWNQATKNALRQRLADGEDPYEVCKPTVPVELLSSLLMDWLHELPGGLWGQEWASKGMGWPHIACTSPSRKVVAKKGNGNLLQLLEKTLGEKADVRIDKAIRVAPLLDAIEPRRREVLLWLLAMLDLAVEYKEHSKMGYAEFAAVFEPYLVPRPGMQLFQPKEQRQYAEKLLVSARALLANYEAHHKAAAPQPDISKEGERRRSSIASPARALKMLKLKKHAKQSWWDKCSAMCAPTVEGLAD
eukprot:scaffold105971_cov63-Phaeocystis_antarctica.AAC.5